MAYIDEDSHLGERQNELWNGYGFHCKCIKCEAEAAATFLTLISVLKEERADKAEPPLTGAELQSALAKKIPKDMEALREYFVGFAEKRGVGFEALCLDIVQTAPAELVGGFDVTSS